MMTLDCVTTMSEDCISENIPRILLKHLLSAQGNIKTWAKKDVTIRAASFDYFDNRLIEKN